jgi:hypothetical protein
MWHSGCALPQAATAQGHGNHTKHHHMLTRYLHFSTFAVCIKDHAEQVQGNIQHPSLASTALRLPLANQISCCARNACRAVALVCQRWPLTPAVGPAARALLLTAGQRSRHLRTRAAAGGISCCKIKILPGAELGCWSSQQQIRSCVGGTAPHVARCIVSTTHCIG